MSGPEFQASDSALWQQVAGLRPRLRDGVEILVQDYRGERWYLLHDQTSGQFLRFNGAAYEFVGRLDGDLTVREIVELANSGFEDAAVISPDEILQIMAQLNGAEALRGGLPVSVGEMLDRQQAQGRRRRRALSNPLALRIPLFDPDRLLGAILPPFRWVFSVSGFVAWTLVVAVAAMLAIANADTLFAAIAAKTLNTNEMLMFVALYPAIKALHELGHGLAVKVWGGQVHETGINLLLFMPVPYVDASAAWAYRDKRRRAIVGAAGIMVELLIAAVALFVWLTVEPGIVRDIALNTALIGGISTLLFNGNPLLRFDGYYVLEDLIEIPSLSTRSTRFYLYLIQTRLLGVEGTRSPVTAPGEAAWFTAYGLMAPIYRLTVMVGIALYLAGEFLVIGVVLAMWAIFMQVGRPLFRAIRFLATSPMLQAHRLRGAVVVVLALSLGIGLLSLPAPLVSTTEGVVWPKQQARVVSATEGFVEAVQVESGQQVRAGDVLLVLTAPSLHAKRDVLAARLQRLRSERMAEQPRNRVRAAMIDGDIATVHTEMAQVQAKLAALTVRSETDGRYYPVDPHDPMGKLVRQGDVLGYVLKPERPLIRAVVSQDAIGLLRAGPVTAQVMMANRLGVPIDARLEREVPAGSHELPDIALGVTGGGQVSVDREDETGLTAAEQIFQIELSLPDNVPIAGLGERAYVRLHHGSESLWQQWSRGLRQLLLSRLQT